MIHHVELHGRGHSSVIQSWMNVFPWLKIQKRRPVSFNSVRLRRAVVPCSLMTQHLFPFWESKIDVRRTPYIFSDFHSSNPAPRTLDPPDITNYREWGMRLALERPFLPNEYSSLFCARTLYDREIFHELPCQPRIPLREFGRMTLSRKNDGQTIAATTTWPHSLNHDHNTISRHRFTPRYKASLVDHSKLLST